MKIFNLCTLLVLMISLAGCATAEKYDAQMASYLQMTERDLVLRWGTPDNVYKVSDRERIFTYNVRETYHNPGTPASTVTEVIDGEVYTRTTGGTPPSTYHSDCMTNFVIRGGYVVDYSFRGNGCVSL